MGAKARLLLPAALAPAPWAEAPICFSSVDEESRGCGTGLGVLLCKGNCLVRVELRAAGPTGVTGAEKLLAGEDPEGTDCAEPQSPSRKVWSHAVNKDS